jgi:DNA (cytosine-5)-methyltransferase 1
MDLTTSNKTNKVKKNKNKKLVLVDDKLKFIDLFAGTGAFTLALEGSNKFKCVFTNDMIESSKKIYKLNNPDHNFTLKDLNTIDVANIPSHNLLCGGFPCQPFSIAGEQKGFDDKRSNVFWKIVEILENHKPETIILENVKNLKSHDKGNTYRIIEQKLEELGYHIKTSILDTNKITNIPQHRERIYIVGFLDKKKYDIFNFNFPEQEQGTICDMLEKDVDDKYYYSDRFKVFEEVEKGVTKNISENVLYQYRRYYVRENKSNCCPTLTANMGGGGHNVPLLKDDKGIRKLTPRECFNLQGFPRDYKLPDLCDSALYKLAGNAVSVPVVNLVVNKLKSIM